MKKIFRLKPLIGIGAVGIFLLCIFISPTEVISSSKSGIQIWFNSVFPALFPFMVGANLLIGLGAVSFIGVILEPIMKPLFNVSGAGAFTMVMGMISGYPVGAKITSDLYLRGDITKTEAERLLSFSNNSGPLFMLGAVGVGLFGSARIGFYILAVHYISALINGLIFRFYKKSELPKATRVTSSGSTLQRAFRNLKSHKISDKRKFGQILGDSVRAAMDISVQVGGYIILFSVIGKILSVTGATSLATGAISNLLSLSPSSRDLASGFIFGLLEVTNGVSEIASSGGIPIAQFALSCFAIGFGGLSIHAQSTSIISKTDISVSVYTLAKISHGTISALVAIAMYLIFIN